MNEGYASCCSDVVTRSECGTRPLALLSVPAWYEKAITHPSRSLTVVSFQRLLLLFSLLNLKFFPVSSDLRPVYKNEWFRKEVEDERRGVHLNRFHTCRSRFKGPTSMFASPSFAMKCFHIRLGLWESLSASAEVLQTVIFDYFCMLFLFLHSGLCVFCIQKASYYSSFCPWNVHVWGFLWANFARSRYTHGTAAWSARFPSILKACSLLCVR